MVSFRGEGDRNLFYYAHDEAEIEWAPIKAAKAKLELPFMVHPRRVQLESFTDGIQVTPDRHDRVLAIGGTPPFVCDFALIHPHSEEAGIIAALTWVLSDAVDPRATTMADMFSRIVKGPVREIPLEELEAEDRFRAYQRGE